MSVVTPEIRFFADCHWLMADNIILLRNRNGKWKNAK